MAGKKDESPLWFGPEGSHQNTNLSVEAPKEFRVSYNGLGSFGRAVKAAENRDEYYADAPFIVVAHRAHEGSRFLPVFAWHQPVRSMSGVPMATILLAAHDRKALDMVELERRGHVSAVINAMKSGENTIGLVCRSGKYVVGELAGQGWRRIGASRKPFTCVKCEREIPVGSSYIARVGRGPTSHGAIPTNAPLHLTCAMIEYVRNEQEAEECLMTPNFSID